MRTLPDGTLKSKIQMTLRYYHIAGFLFLIAFPAFSQNQGNYKQLTTEEGLSHSTVYAVLKDRHGFMWFGSLGGLNRYDGYRFYTFKHRAGDTTSLDSDNVRCLFEDNEGSLWVGTGGGGLSLYNADENTFLTFRESTSTSDISNDGVTAISEDDDGNVWIGTYWDSIYLIARHKSLHSFIMLKAIRGA